ncbi:MAG: hypothetical protein R3325_07525 [Thermoanaerobaculia bacterium]|nr:hypothetical protein [Thermoanaerobaculia bacterium]
MPTTRILLALLLLAAVALPATAAYTVFLKDGSKIIAREPFTVEGEKAIIILQNGARTSIAATEIDLDRTREANRGNLGGSLVLDDGRTTELSGAPEPPKRETLSDLIARRQVGPGTRRTASDPADREPVTVDAPGSAPSDFDAVPRRPFHNLEIAGEVQRFFRAQGVQQMLIYQGTRPRNMLLAVTTNSEASVFRALEVAAACLEHIQTSYAGEIDAFELAFATVDREPGGQFLLDAEAATLLTGDLVETSAFFVERVRF